MEFFELDETFIGGARTTNSALNKGTVKQADPYIIYTNARDNYGTIIDDGKSTFSGWSHVGSKSQQPFPFVGPDANNAESTANNAMNQVCKNLRK